VELSRRSSDLKKRGLTGVRLIISDACIGLSEAAAEVFPDADWQRCAVHFYRNVFSHVPRGKMREVAAMLKAIHAQESREAAEIKSKDVVQKLKAMKLKAAAELVENSIHETLAYYAYPSRTGSKSRQTIRWNGFSRRPGAGPKLWAHFPTEIQL